MSVLPTVAGSATLRFPAGNSGHAAGAVTRERERACAHFKYFFSNGCSQKYVSIPGHQQGCPQGFPPSAHDAKEERGPSAPP